MEALLIPCAVSLLFGFVFGVFYRTHRTAVGTCEGCRKPRCEIIGSGAARRRRHAFCAVCMPELYR